MKHYTSRLLKSVALFYLGFPVAYILVVAIVFNIAASFCLRILLSPSYYLLSLLAMVAGYGLWEMRRWAWHLFVGVNVLIGYENAVLLNEYGDLHNKGLAFAASISALIIVIYRVGREIRVPYFFPKIRWWESNPRYKLSVPVQIIRPESEELSKFPNSPNSEEASGPIEGQILDISMGGCFIKLRAGVVQDERLHLRFAVFGNEIQCSGTVVWCTQSTVTHPRGVGVKFAPLARSERRALRLVTRRLRKIATFYRRSRYLLNQDEFIRKLEELETQGQTSRNRPARKSS